MKQFKGQFIGGMLALAGAVLAACASAPAGPEPAALTAPAAEIRPAFSAEGVAALETRMASYVDGGTVKGIATRLIQDGEIISDFRHGIRRQADGAPVEEDTIWRIYSMSKPVTGVGLMILWEEGMFQLDDPITKYFPEFEGLQVFKGLDEAGNPLLAPVSRPPTVQELMSHTAGFGYGLAPGNYVDDRFRELEVFQSPDAGEMIRRVATIPLKHEPGVTWDYSISVDIQGALIERLSGQTLGEFLEARVFQPLGMTDTAFFVPDEKYDRFSDVWGPNPETGELVPLPMPGFQYRKDTIAFEGGGHGLVGTLGDYARFTDMLAKGGTLDGVQVLKPETVQLMATNFLPEGVFIGHNGTTTDPNAGGGFGLDFAVILKDGEAYPKGAFMWGGAAGTWFWVDPVNKVSFVGMIQVFGGSLDRSMRTESAELVYDALQEIK